MFGDDDCVGVALLLLLVDVGGTKDDADACVDVAKKRRPTILHALDNMVNVQYDSKQS